MTIQEAILIGTKKLKNLNASTSSSLDAEVLLSFALNKPKTYLITHANKKLSKKYIQTYIRLLNQRTKGKPVAYLTGHKEFFGLDFKVNKNVLIPRPETEELVELAINKITSSSFSRPRILRIVDIGTGSGNIIISIARSMMTKPTSRTGRQANKRPLRSAKAGHAMEYFASDISKQALAVAKKNAKTHKVKIKFKQGGLMSPWKKEKLDVIVANLPYGWKEWKNNTSAETQGLKFEPQTALFTDNNGLALYEKLFQQLAKRMSKPSMVALEFDPRQKIQIKKLVDKHLPAYDSKIIFDLSGRLRFLLLELSDR